jgi:hypothetical protein
MSGSWSAVYPEKSIRKKGALKEYIEAKKSRLPGNLLYLFNLEQLNLELLS